MIITIIAVTVKFLFCIKCLDTVQSAWQALSHIILTAIPWNGFFSFIEEEVGPEGLSNLPKVTQPVNGKLVS